MWLGPILIIPCLPYCSRLAIWLLFPDLLVVKCESKIGHQKHVCLKEIGLRAQIPLTISSSIASIIRSPVEKL